MKIRVNNVNNNIEDANIIANVILKEVINRLAEDGTEIADIKLDEIGLTFSVQPKEQKDYTILSVEHEDVTEMLTVDYDLETGVREDNEQVSLFSEGERTFVTGGATQRFEEIESKFKEELKSSELIGEDSYGDMTVVDYRLQDGRIVQQIFQQGIGSIKGPYLIQELTYSEDVKDIKDNTTLEGE